MVQTVTTFTDNEKGDPVLTIDVPEEYTDDINNPLKKVSWQLFSACKDGESDYIVIDPKSGSVTIPTGAASFEVPMSGFQSLYTCEYSYDHEGPSFMPSSAVIHLEVEDKTFDIPVYNGWGEDTNQKISVTNTSTGDFSSIGLNGKYILVYDGEKYYYSYSNYTTMEALWGVIQIIADEKGEFDVSKAKLVRDVKYNVYVNDYDWESFTSIDLMNEVKDNIGLNYLNERKTSGSIWRINCFEIDPETYDYIYTKKLATGDSFDAGIKAFLNENDCDSVDLRDKEKLYITATDPSTVPHEDSEITLYEDSGQYITIDTDKQYPVKVSDLADKLTTENAPTAGMTYNKDEWELWPCSASTGNITVESKATVDDPTADIGITHYELALEQDRNYILVYIKQVEIAPSLEVTAPVAGETPSFEYKIVDKVGGYSVVSVEWSCDNTLLGENDKFEAGKEYTVEIVLDADQDLSFVDSTPVTINGEKAITCYDENMPFSAYRSFTIAPEKPANVKATAGDGKVDLSWEEGKGAFGYNVYLYNEDGTLRQIATVEDLSHDLSCTVENLANGTEYGFLIRAVSEAGVESSYTAEDVVYATPDAPPSKPVNVKAAAGDGKVTVSWDLVEGATKYAVYTYLDGKYYAKGTTTTTTYTVTGLTNGTEIGFLVRAGADGNWSSFTTDDVVYATPFSIKPKVTATPGDSEVTLSWEAPDGATKYGVYTYIDGKYYAKGTTTATTYTVTGLTNGTKTGFLVRAYVDGAWSSFTSADVVYATPVASKPKVTATPGDSAVKLSWTVPTGATKYGVYTYIDGKYYAKGTTTATTYTVTGLTNGTKIGFLVRAYIDGAWSSFTSADVVYATPVAGSCGHFRLACNRSCVYNIFCGEAAPNAVNVCSYKESDLCAVGKSVNGVSRCGSSTLCVVFAVKVSVNTVFGRSGGCFPAKCYLAVACGSLYILRLGA
ncbi:MAG: fibronectin type III domain-containing protein [Oscillospiraceae bacterium]